MKRKTKLDKAVEVVAKIIEEHLETLPKIKAKAMLRDLHELAAKTRQRHKASKLSGPSDR